MENSAVSNTADLLRINGSANANKATLMQMRNSGSDDQALRLAANEFAGLFLGQMYQIMNSTVQKSGLIDGGPGENMFREMLTQEYARNAAYDNAYGLGEMIYRSLKVRAGINDAPDAAAPAANKEEPL